jgi:hypothetical protein
MVGWRAHPLAACAVTTRTQPSLKVLRKMRRVLHAGYTATQRRQFTTSAASDGGARRFTDGALAAAAAAGVAAGVSGFAVVRRPVHVTLRMHASHAACAAPVSSYALAPFPPRWPGRISELSGAVSGGLLRQVGYVQSTMQPQPALPKAGTKAAVATTPSTPKTTTAAVTTPPTTPAAAAKPAIAVRVQAKRGYQRGVHVARVCAPGSMMRCSAHREGVGGVCRDPSPSPTCTLATCSRPAWYATDSPRSGVQDR